MVYIMTYCSHKDTYVFPCALLLSSYSWLNNIHMARVYLNEWILNVFNHYYFLCTHACIGVSADFYGSFVWLQHMEWLTALKWLLAQWPVLSVMPVIWTKRALYFSLLSFLLKICRANDRRKHIEGVTRVFETGGINQFSFPVCFKRAREWLDLRWGLSASWLDSGPCHYGLLDGDNVEHCSAHTICLL